MLLAPVESAGAPQSTWLVTTSKATELRKPKHLLKMQALMDAGARGVGVTPHLPYGTFWIYNKCPRSVGGYGQNLKDERLGYEGYPVSNLPEHRSLPLEAGLIRCGPRFIFASTTAATPLSQC
jgi:hypothetical protein